VLSDRPWSWTIAADAAEVHTLLLASDVHQASRYDLPIPARRLATTARRVAAGEVHVLRHGDEPAAMFTLSDQPPFDEAAAGFPRARRPVYLQRLAVRPSVLRIQPLAGAQCLRRAVETAERAGFDVLRSEANPDLDATWTMLLRFGFEPQGEHHRDGAVCRAYLQKTLRPRAD
jgi:hypothetical protein